MKLYLLTVISLAAIVLVAWLCTEFKRDA